MKRLLAILGAVGLTATGSTAVVACSKSSDTTKANDLSKIKSFEAPTAFKANDYTTVKEADVKKALKNSVLIEVQKLVSTATESDYTFGVYNDGSGGEYAPVDVSENSKNVYVKVKAATTTKTDPVLIGETGYIKVTLPAVPDFVKGDLSKVTVIAPAPVEVAEDPSKVTMDEVKDALKDTVLAAVNSVALAADGTDFTYKVSSDDQGVETNPIDLTTESQPVFVKITAKTDNALLEKATNFIKVTLPRFKYDLGLKEIEIEPVEVVRSDSVEAVPKTHVMNSLKDNVLTAVKTVVSTATTTDYKFDIFADALETPYKEVDITTNDPVDRTVYVEITATK
ncbi:spiralin lipoprotein [Spiroplasma chrysopicola]|uniref:Spiralin n=1 Tax=Spiroplasma chrysopicola DF-1 TaxID=1276227 RepID=R4U107_9MOLU|nr:spiralin lipoprotein [Spiroplasma chrysopicola]AGM24997.1 spiralin [Spiroplasma chrysopicola DF-1]